MRVIDLKIKEVLTIGQRTRLTRRCQAPLSLVVMSNSDIKISLTHDEALVLFEMMSRFSGTDE